MTTLFPAPGPQLPPYQTLLVKGYYPSASPIHLLLSHNSEDPHARAILLTPSRKALQDELFACNDEWVANHGGGGHTADQALRAQIYYPPTVAHLRLILSMFTEYDGTIHHDKTTLDVAPTLVVLHEISTYFSHNPSHSTLASYLSIISTALDLVGSWSPSSPARSRLVVFDSGLGDLQLPILKALNFSEEDEESPRRDTTSAMVERYFEWVADVEEDAAENAEPHTDNEYAHKKMLQLRRLQGPTNLPIEDGEWTWTWSESRSVKQRTVFGWS